MKLNKMLGIIAILLPLLSFQTISENKCVRNYGWCSNLAEFEYNSSISVAISQESNQLLIRARNNYVSSISECVNELEDCQSK